MLWTSARRATVLPVTRGMARPSTWRRSAGWGRIPNTGAASRHCGPVCFRGRNDVNTDGTRITQIKRIEALSLYPFNPLNPCPIRV
ncbi:protein of unknown function [Candidatus Promineifilum breve]|uniref:Uncharacterized protein n=1 Tax=Candidatus Promineifilum breve TaxID=1806508 RepID=A0A160T176_9CHLR|nr:protein of unknown function [Candidatus Promineifilum breve]